jgi:hypothetical protein
LPKSIAGVLDVFFDLALLSPRGRIAELDVERIVAGPSRKASVDPPFLAQADPIHSRAHVVTYPALRNAA